MALRGVCTRARLRRVPFNNGRAHSWYLCIHISNHVAKLRSVAARDPGIRCSGGNRFHRRRLQRHTLGYQRKHSVRLVFHNTPMPCPVEGTPLWGPGSTPGKFTDYCGFLKAPGTEKEWLIKTFLQNLIGVRDMSSEALGLKPNDQAHSRYLGFLHFNADRIATLVLGAAEERRSYRVGVLHLSPRCATSVSSWCFHLDCLSGGGWRDRMRQLRVSR